MHSVQFIIITNHGGYKHFVLCNYHFREDCAPASSKTDSDTPLLVDVDTKKVDDPTASSNFEFLEQDPSGRKQRNYVHVLSTRPTLTSPENFYVSDQPDEIKETTDEVIYVFVVVFM